MSVGWLVDRLSAGERTSSSFVRLDNEETNPPVYKSDEKRPIPSF